jgi:hypothetical protein
MNRKPAPKLVLIIFAAGVVSLLGWQAWTMMDSVLDSWNMKKGIFTGAALIMLIDIALIGLIVAAGIAGALRRKRSHAP